MLNRFLLHLFKSPESIEDKISKFWHLHANCPDTEMGWDAFKEVLHGVFISEISSIKERTRGIETQVVRMVCQREGDFIVNPSDSV